MSLLDTLLAIREQATKGNTQIRKYGICYTIHLVSRSRVIEPEVEQFKELYTKWPEYTGKRNYPVPSCDPLGRLSPVSAFTLAYDMYEGEYGAARMRLLNWCIEELQK